MRKIVVAGGGAAGFFAAITCAECHPEDEIIILERSQKLLSKVKLSGGGRCNVTHACFDNRALVKFYPRGEKQLLGPFTRFGPTQTIEWFADKDVPLKTETDGRMFPVTDSSQTIIDCMIHESQRKKVKIVCGCGLDNLVRKDVGWLLHLSDRNTLTADSVIIATGSAQRVWDSLQTLGHQIISPVPSLFTFKIRDRRIQNLPGISLENVSVYVPEVKGLQTDGAILITHWGLSGPAILKLSAWGARSLAELNYKFSVVVNWLGTRSKLSAIEEIRIGKKQYARKNVSRAPLFDIPTRLWKSLMTAIGEDLNYADLSNLQIEQMAEALTHSIFQVEGKSTFKEEFVTAGGVDLNEVDFKTMQSKLFPDLFFAGEVMDIDAITGGFNFQAAWTTGYLAGLNA